MKKLSFFLGMWYKRIDIVFLPAGKSGDRWEDTMKEYCKKLTAILLVLLMVLSGCGNGNDKKETSAGTTEGTTEAEIEPLPPLIQIENIDEYVTLGTYLGIEVEKGSAELTDKEIEEAIEDFLDYYKDYEQIKEGVVAKGDTVGIDYVGKLDGVAFQGGTGSYDLKIGSGSFIDGFEDGLIGAKVGETVDLNLTFPDPYKNNPDLAGKAVVFTVTVKYKLSAEKVRPEFDQALAEKLKFKTVEEMRENIIKTLDEQKKTAVENNFMIALWDAVIANCEIKKHDDIYAEYYDSFIMQYESMAAQYMMTLEKFIEAYYGIKYDEFIGHAQDYATSCMEQELVCRAIAKNENMVVTDEDYAKTLAEYYKQYSSHFKDEAAIEAYYGKDRLRNDILIQNAMDLVRENAVAVAPSEDSTSGATEEATKSAE